MPQPHWCTSFESRQYYMRTGMEWFGIPWEQFAPPEKREEQCDVLGAARNTMDGWYVNSNSQFILGDTPCFADFMGAGCFEWIQYCFERSKELERRATRTTGGCNRHVS
ncbi:hypothetical protein DFH29DRAFT_835748 [Suillus ampliporus]|nr:hypothetical protein DFH29DRAFT_835748 [Suillus ampliporus]